MDSPTHRNVHAPVAKIMPTLTLPNGTGHRELSPSASGMPEYKTVTPTARKVAGSVPVTAIMLCLVECAERASYWGVRTVFSNFMQFPLPAGGNGAGAPPPGTQQTAGALGKGLRFSNAFGLLFQFLVCVMPLFGGWLADAKFGRYPAVVAGVWISAVSHLLMSVCALPSLLASGRAIGLFMISFFLLAIGTGLFKPNIAPMIIDQYRNQRPYTKQLPSGETVVVDPETTIQRLLLLFYGLINVGALFGIPTSFAAKKSGFWLAFLAPGLLYLPIPLLLFLFRGRITKVSADGSELPRVFHIMTVAVRRNKGRFWARNFWDLAKPSVWMLNHDTARSAPNGARLPDEEERDRHWTDKHVDEVRRAVSACQIFLLLPLYHLNNGGVGSVAHSQASTMVTDGVPNDLLDNINPLVIIVATPVLARVVYPLLACYKIRFGRASRLTLGFALASLSSAFGALVQWRVYEASPCGYQGATGCAAGVSPLSVWWQVPSVAAGALSECFCLVTAYELAYARAPPNMRATVTAMLLLSNGLASALGLLITPAIADPHLIWVWAGPAVALFAQTYFFYFRFRHLDNDEFMLGDDGDSGDGVQQVVVNGTA